MKTLICCVNKKLHRIYTNFQLQLSVPIILDSSTSNYVGRVLRRKEGDQIQCFDGKGTEAICSVSSNKAERYELKVERVFSVPERMPPKAHLAIGMLKGQAMDRAMQHSIELGATDIWLLQSERSNVHLSNERLRSKSRHWFRVCVSSCEQCGESYLPIIHGPMTIDQLFRLTPTIEKIILDPSGKPFSKELPVKERILFIGPEGGWSPQEKNFFASQRLSCFSMGERVIRAENAPTVGLALAKQAQNLL